MYKSKRNGRNTYCYFDPEFEQELNQLKKLKAELSRAIINNEFVLHYQPIINSNSNTIDKAEALIRWQHPSKGLLSPYHFIDVAEKTHLIEAIGDWVLHQAIQDCARWSQIENLHHIGVSINLSAHQFSEGHLSAKIKRELENHHFGHGKVTLEITETAIMETGEPLFQQLQEFSQLGIDIAIDDFGTGYSSLSYLKQLPVGILKVDRSFVSDIDHDEDDRIISKAIINLGHSLNKSIIAEGIETKEQLDMIRQYGCHLIQGYYYAKPMPWDEFVNWCSQFQQTKS
jgi:EAL domain-containing protein (putative c-di-GMP-specific phosphodiesterase class I)